MYAEFWLVAAEVIQQPCAAGGLLEQMPVERCTPTKLQPQRLKCEVIGGAMAMRFRIGQSAVEIEKDCTQSHGWDAARLRQHQDQVIALILLRT
jgi:hypothetical protein